MDIDTEVDGRLAQQFGCLGTVDKDTLVLNFQQILSGSSVDLNKDTCRFFLDMNNWNLPAALGSFYDFSAQELLNVPSMVFVEDVTIGEGESVPPNTKFVKTWRISNPSLEKWPEGCALKQIHGEIVCESDFALIKQAEPGESIDVSVTMVSPSTSGMYQSLWRMITPNFVPFGENIWCIITVEEGGVLSVTQQLAATHCCDIDESENDQKAASSFKEQEKEMKFGPRRRTSSFSFEPFMDEPAFKNCFEYDLGSFLLTPDSSSCNDETEISDFNSRQGDAHKQSNNHDFSGASTSQADQIELTESRDPGYRFTSDDNMQDSDNVDENSNKFSFDNNT